MQQIKGSNVMARCKAGEESEDKDTETDPGACTSQITWPVVTFSLTYIFF